MSSSCVDALASLKSSSSASIESSEYRAGTWYGTCADTGSTYALGLLAFRRGMVPSSSRRSRRRWSTSHWFLLGARAVERAEAMQSAAALGRAHVVAALARVLAAQLGRGRDHAAPRAPVRAGCSSWAA
ncbi:hypothetical protein PINS_up021910 [Pythium insidiosum]|nr:hypothetical protein PINS_up021910 [Pythium insidiosum]